MTVSGSRFESANIVATYEEQREPVYQTEKRIEYVIESGWFGDRRIPKEVEKVVHLGDRVKKIPVFHRLKKCKR